MPGEIATHDGPFHHLTVGFLFARRVSRRSSRLSGVIVISLFCIFGAERQCVPLTVSHEGARGALRLRKIILWTTDSTRAGDQRDMTIAVSRV